MNKQDSPKSNERKPLFPVILKFLMLLLIITGGIWAYYFFTKQPYELLTFSKEDSYIVEVLPQQADLQSYPSLPVVEAQLKALREHDIDKAYKEFTSKEFQKATPLDDFRKFIKDFPVLVDYKSVQFGQESIDQNQAKLNVTLETNFETYPVEYILTQEDDLWKVWSIKVLTPSTTAQTSTEENEKMMTVIREHLNLLKQKDIEKSYTLYTSEEFKKVTSLRDFELFLNNYPELTTFNTFRFGESSKENGFRLIKVILSMNGEESSLDIWMTQEKDQWKILGIQVEKSLTYPPIQENEMKILSQMILDQLNAIREGDLSKAYYAFVSQEFEKSSSFEDFKRFIKNYPMLTEYDAFNILEGVVEGNSRLIRALLEEEGQKYFVHYRFDKENKLWKISGIEILLDSEEMKEEKTVDENIQLTIQEQLNAIRNKDVSKAYYAYTSHEFQEETPREIFVSFIKSHPILANYTNFDLVSQKMDGDQAILVIRFSDSQTSEIFRYQLTFEGNRWRILSIQVEEVEEKEPSKPSEINFEKVEMGTEVDAQSKVTKPTLVFSPEDKKIILNIYARNGKKGESISVILHHLQTGSKLDPVTAMFGSDGDAVFSFAFTSPEKGWPDGSYQFETYSSTGYREVFSFEVIKRSNQKIAPQ